jgi:UDP-perosamine 4-acetyltransferase
MNKKKLLIFPFNGNAIEALDCIQHDEFEFIGFVDDNLNKDNPHNFPLFGKDAFLKHPDAYVLAVPGSPTSYTLRAEIIESLNLRADRFVSVIHPSANIGRNVTIGRNCLIMAGVVLTSNAEIESHVCILPNSVVHHDSKIKAYALIGSNVVIAGGTEIGRNCYIGSGSNIINGLTLGDFTMVGLGSNVVKDTAANAKIAGNPAKEITIHHE